MIRRAIFGMVHGRGVKEIWLISKFPAEHKGVAGGPKIVFARPETSETHQLLYDLLGSDFMSVM